MRTGDLAARPPCRRRRSRTGRPRTRPGSSAAAASARSGRRRTAALLRLGVDRRVRDGRASPFGIRSVSCHGTLNDGLVEARERAPRVGRLELREGVPVLAVLLAEEALGRGLVHDARELEVQLQRPRARPAGRRRTRRTPSLPGSCGSADRTTARGRRRGLLDLELLGVEPEHVGLLLDADVDVDGAAEGGLAGVDRQVDGVAGGLRHRGQPEAREAPGVRRSARRGARPPEPDAAARIAAAPGKPEISHAPSSDAHS